MDKNLFDLLEITTRALHTAQTLTNAKLTAACALVNESNADEYQKASLCKLLNEVDTIIKDCARTSVIDMRKTFTESAEE